MSDPLRAFLAVPIPAEAGRVAGATIEQLRRETPSGVRWADEAQLHLTLKFLGDLERSELERLAHSAGAALRREARFAVELGALGAFPSARQARVVWMGVEQGRAELARLARKLDRAAARLGVPRERRPYRAHLTLGRVREPRPIAVERIAAPERVSFPVEEVVLYESRLASGGATHLPLARLPLGLADPSSDIDPDIDFAPEL